LMNEYGRSVTQLAFTYVKDWALAEDVAQEVFVTCYRKIKTFKGRSSIKTWLYRVTVNRSKDLLRKAKASGRLVESIQHNYSQQSALSSEQEYLKLDEDRQLTDFVLSLPVKYREIIILFYYEGFAIKEISQLMKMNEKTVKTRLHRGRLLLKEQYEGGEQ
ncbi:MAG TPA: sigma-70 family RNA polymerase sigma factor, partial [Bacillales bacterium]